MKTFRFFIFLLLLLALIVASQDFPLQNGLVKFQVMAGHMFLHNKLSSSLQQTAVKKTNLFTYLHYPKAQQTAKSDNTLVLQSYDDQELITDWYKAYIEKNGFINKTFVQTNINDDIQNKLIAQKNRNEISIEVNKNATDSAAIITISVSSLSSS